MKFKIKCIKLIQDDITEYFSEGLWYEMIYFDVESFHIRRPGGLVWLFYFNKEKVNPHFDLSAFHKLKIFI